MEPATPDTSTNRQGPWAYKDKLGFGQQWPIITCEVWDVLMSLATAISQQLPINLFPHSYPVYHFVHHILYPFPCDGLYYCTEKIERLWWLKGRRLPLGINLLHIPLKYCTLSPEDLFISQVVFCCCFALDSAGCSNPSPKMVELWTNNLQLINTYILKTIKIN